MEHWSLFRLQSSANVGRRNSVSSHGPTRKLTYAKARVKRKVVNTNVYKSENSRRFQFLYFWEVARVRLRLLTLVRPIYPVLCRVDARRESQPRFVPWSGHCQQTEKQCGRRSSRLLNAASAPPTMPSPTLSTT
jgi:hypothetical protein